MNSRLISGQQDTWQEQPTEINKTDIALFIFGRSDYHRFAIFCHSTTVFKYILRIIYLLENLPVFNRSKMARYAQHAER